MKKIFKTLAVCAVAGTLCAGVAALTGCDSKEQAPEEATYFGQYHYNSNNTEYGIAVNVTVKGDEITKVEKVDSNYTEVTTSFKIDGVWDDTSIANWNNNLNALLAKYNGLTVDAVKAVTGSIDGVADAEENKISDSNLLTTGATQGSVRLLKAVQNALETKTPAATVVNGEYHYNASNTEYGIKVKVAVVDGKIFSVNKVDSDYTEVTTSYKIDGVWDDTSIANWNDNLSTLLTKYNGLTVDAVKAVTGSISGQEDAEENAISNDTLLISGATQGSVRLLKAVQNALENL